MGLKRRAPSIEKIELSEKNLKPRFLFFILFLLVAIAAFAIAITSLLKVDDGWTEISVNSAAQTNCGGDFKFEYYLGESGISAAAEKKELTMIYTEAMLRAYRIFNAENDFSGIANVSYINKNLNSEVQIEPELYASFELLEKYGNRYIYLAPLYSELYGQLFFSNDDYDAVLYDPHISESLKQYFAKVAEFARNKDSISLELLGGNRVILHVSEEYKAFAEENGLDVLIDFSWMKNAFIADMISDILVQKSYTLGIITSCDGFTRKNYSSSQKFDYNLFSSGKYVAALEYSGCMTFVRMRDFILDSHDTGRYYVYDNGTTRTLYLGLDDGLCKSSVSELDAYSSSLTCSELLMKVAPLYIADGLHTSDLSELAKDGVNTVFALDKTIYYTDKNAKIKSPADGFSISPLS